MIQYNFYKLVKTVLNQHSDQGKSTWHSIISTITILNLGPPSQHGPQQSSKSSQLQPKQSIYTP